ncbi:hypothetical protein DFS34DRAFT_104683 [Phlyctochytrium arcticum]|nr:hypothetical protein DFS34DRAFT_104683 [Phlyctochytrium arcticum]
MLAKMSRVCRLWRSATIPLLLHAPQVTSEHRAEKLCALLKFGKEFAEIFRVWNWPFSSHWYYYHFSGMQNVKTLAHNCTNLYVSDFAPSPSSCSSDECQGRYLCGTQRHIRQHLKYSSSFATCSNTASRSS